MKKNGDGELPATPWPTPDVLAALSDEALRRASSAAVFLRGQTYARSGAVQVTGEQGGETPSIVATVTGSEPYDTEVSLHHGRVAGECDCPSARDIGFCKHQVALALVWRAALSGETPWTDDAQPGAVKGRAITRKDRRQALGEFLRGRSHEELVDRLMALAGDDREIARELEHWRLSSELPASASEAKALVTRIMSPGRSFVAWDEGTDYVQRAKAVLPLLATARERDAVAAVALSLHAMRRGWAVLAQADDSDGDIGDLVAAIGAAWVSALLQAGPQPAAFGDAYLQLLFDDPFGSFDSAAVEAAMGEAALSRFRTTLARRWREASDAALTQGASREVASEVHLPTLRDMQVAQLEMAGDVDGALAVLRRNLCDAIDHRRVTSFLERHGRLREAFANAELAYRKFPKDRLVEDELAEWYERDGWVDEALALRRRQFEAEPSVMAYQRVLAAGEAAHRDPASLRDELHAVLIAHEESPRMWNGSRPRARLGPAEPRDVTLRVAILRGEARWDEALALVQPPAECREEVLASLARALDAGYAVQRVELLMRVFKRAMAGATSPYQRPLDLVAEICAMLEPAVRATWLGQLRAAYKAKRNFIRGLPTG